MTVRDLVEKLNLTVQTTGTNLDTRVTGGYAGDLLSDVMANSKSGNVWVTMQVHVNIVAVAVLKEHAAIILVNHRTPAEDTLRRANEEHITVLTSGKPAFETIGALVKLGLSGIP